MITAEDIKVPDGAPPQIAVQEEGVAPPNSMDMPQVEPVTANQDE